MVPNSTWDEDAWSVVHVMVADEAVIFDTFTAEMTGGGARVVKLKLLDVASAPAAFADNTA